jgi:hypothetical protein
MTKSIDFGLISLLLIQLFIAIACLFAWNSIRVESANIRAAFLELKARFTLTDQISELSRAAVSNFETRVNKCEDGAAEIRRALQIAEEARTTALAASSDVVDVERSMKAKLSALSRWNRPKPDDEDEGDPSPVPIQENLLPEPSQTETRRTSFGRSAV